MHKRKLFGFEFVLSFVIRDVVVNLFDFTRDIDTWCVEVLGFGVDYHYGHHYFSLLRLEHDGIEFGGDLFGLVGLYEAWRNR